MLRDYRVINTRLVSTLARQLNLNVADGQRVVETEVGFDVKIVNAKSRRQRSRQPLATNDPRLLVSLVEELRERGYLTDHRPETNREFREREWKSGMVFIEESLPQVVPAHLPITDFGDATLPAHLTVWVSEPPVLYEPIDANGYENVKGSFLFLVEELTNDHLDETDNHTSPVRMMSGLSALQMIVDVIGAGYDLSATSLAKWRRERPRPRFNAADTRHPLEKLAEVGATIGRTRDITAAYKISYMTDEAGWVIDGQPARLNDIMAYPLYISNP